MATPQFLELNPRSERVVASLWRRAFLASLRVGKHEAEAKAAADAGVAAYTDMLERYGRPSV